MIEISVIVPTYNRANLVGKAVNSVLNQTFQNWELIVVDDGSTDDTKNVINGFLKDYRIKYIQKPNTGGAHSRNVGVESATGKYITFLDSDDEALPIWLEELSNSINSSGADIVCCGQTYYKDNKLMEEKLPASMGGIYNYTTGRFLAGSFALKKEAYCEINGLDEQLQSGHWTDFALRLSRTKYFKNVVSINKSLVNIFIHDGAKIRSNSKAVLQGTKLILRKHYNLLRADNTTLRNYLKVIVFHSFKNKSSADFIVHLPLYLYYNIKCKLR